jgi:hypothetical protein
MKTSWQRIHNIMDISFAAVSGHEGWFGYFLSTLFSTTFQWTS